MQFTSPSTTSSLVAHKERKWEGKLLEEEKMEIRNMRKRGVMEKSIYHGKFQSDSIGRKLSHGGGDWARSKGTDCARRKTPVLDSA